MKTQQTWTTVGLPTEMADSISEFISLNKHLGYRSVSDFVREAVRVMLSALQEDNIGVGE